MYYFIISMCRIVLVHHFIFTPGLYIKYTIILYVYVLLVPHFIPPPLQ